MTLPAAAPVRILIAEDVGLVAEGFCKLLEMKPERFVVAGVTDNLDDTLRTLEHAPPDVLLLDLNLPLARQGTPKLAGFDVLEYLGRHKPGVRAIVLSQHNDYSFIKRALHLNARGYMLKNTTSAELFEAIRAVVDGHLYLPPRVKLQLQLRDDPSTDDPTIAFARLSKREVEVVRLVAQGFTSQEIANFLKLQRGTVEEYRENVIGKLGAKNAPDMVRIVYENRLL